MSRCYNNGSGDFAFVFSILLLCSLWTHKDLMIKIEHYAKLGLITAIIIVSAIALLRLVHRIKRWKINPSIAVVDAMSGLEFEKYVARHLRTQGYERVRLTEKYDYGIDIIAVKNGVTWGIQVKRNSGLVKANAVRQAVTALRKYQCDRAMVVTNSEFSRVAIELARCNECVLVDRSELLHWITH